MQAFSNLKRLVITRYDHFQLASRELRSAVEHLSFMFQTIMTLAETIVECYSRKNRSSSSLSTRYFNLKVSSSDGSTLSPEQFRDFGETILGAISSGFIGTFAGYMFLDMPFVLNFDLKLVQRSLIRTDRAQD